jgi:hypothetical protein
MVAFPAQPETDQIPKTKSPTLESRADREYIQRQTMGRVKRRLKSHVGPLLNTRDDSAPTKNPARAGIVRTGLLNQEVGAAKRLGHKPIIGFSGTKSGMKI